MPTHHGSTGASGSERRGLEQRSTTRDGGSWRREVKPLLFLRQDSPMRFVPRRSCPLPSLLFCGGSCRPHPPLPPPVPPISGGRSHPPPLNYRGPQSQKSPTPSCIRIMALRGQAVASAEGRGCSSLRAMACCRAERSYLSYFRATIRQCASLRALPALCPRCYFVGAHAAHTPLSPLPSPR